MYNHQVVSLLPPCTREAPQDCDSAAFLQQTAPYVYSTLQALLAALFSTRIALHCRIESDGPTFVKVAEMKTAPLCRGARHMLWLLFCKELDARSATRKKRATRRMKPWHGPDFAARRPAAAVVTVCWCIAMLTRADFAVSRPARMLLWRAVIDLGHFSLALLRIAYVVVMSLPSLKQRSNCTGRRESCSYVRLAVLVQPRTAARAGRRGPIADLPQAEAKKG